MSKQDELLAAMSNQDTLDLLYDLWRIVKQSPTKATEILIQFRDVTASAKVAVVDIQDVISRFDGLNERLSHIEEFAKRISEVNKSVRGIDESTVLNRLNKLVDLSEKIKQIKHSGSLDIIEALLKK